ncbi:Disease resistance protein [Macleaya cordata]|uniref:Disease resistance protein n=1 Tax=Macleaya cordata TaxID=56857 RepID=A0A200R7X6_MACCD|nr:Disease resistance protein [Macleaya cordata]
MAEAVVTFFLEKLSTLITEESNLLQGVDAEVRLLQNELEWMRLFIKNADAKRRADPEVKLMVSQIRELTFHAEDVIDEFILKIHQQGGQQRIDLGGFIGSFKSCISPTLELPLLHELRNQIKVINTMSEKITANKSKYCIEGKSSSYSSNDFSSVRKVKRAPIAEECDVVGIEDSTKQVKLLLMESGSSDDDRRRRIVVSIVGMGGLGKTTLAKKVYNSSDAKRYFDCFAWVSISQEYTLTKILQDIIECVTTQYSKEELEKLNQEELGKKLREYLLHGNRKYLIVLDDVWDIQAWDCLNTAFPDKKNGSRILLTTRNKNVAVHADSSSNNIHTLRFLNEDESWELFLNKIFASSLGGGSDGTHESKCPLALEEVGKDMVGKCGGLPLAIVVLGGILSSKDKTHIAWSKVNTNVNWQLTHGASSHSCSGILALSYYNLPYYLKPCFLYMGLFPEDHEIPASRLFQCWIAEGFVQSRGEETVEDVAEDYMGELIHRSMIQVGRWRYDGRVRTCRIHDLLRDLAIAESKEDQFSQVFGNVVDFSKSNNVRRLTIHGTGFNQEERRYFSQFRYTLCIRSLMCFRIKCIDKQFWISICQVFKLLKVLELDLFRTTVSIPKAIGELVHLKYLGVSGSPQRPTLMVPNSINKLVNLQTLNLKNCRLECIPSQIWNLHQLRHLYVKCIEPSSNCWTGLGSTNCHLGIDNLTNLQTLCIDSYNGINGGMLGRMKMLKKLVIKKNIPPHMKEIFNSIAKLTGLRSLHLYSSEEFPALIRFSNNSYLTKLNLWGRISSESFLFPPNLIKLELWESKIKTEELIVVLAKLQNLKFLALGNDSYIRKKMIFSQGRFLRLQFLKLYSLNELEELMVEEGALISLTHLEIVGCGKMEMLPDRLQELTSLQELRVYYMPERFIARLSENNGEDWEKIKHIPSVIKEADMLIFEREEWW